MTSYRKRSRNGCITCRRLREKCDEEHPACVRCTQRGICCEGYQATPLRWMNDAETLTGSQLPPPVKLVAPVCVWPFQARLSNSTESFLFQYWTSVREKIVSQDGEAASRLQILYTTSALNGPEALMPVTLANSAAHMANAGKLSGETALQVKQHAVRALRRAIRKHMAPKPLPSPLHKRIDNTCELAIPIHDELIVASVLFLSIGIIDGDAISTMLPFLEGAATLVKERQQYAECNCDKAHPMREMDGLRQDSEMFVAVKRFLAYLDVSSCIPCARAPVLPSLYWNREYLPMDSSGVCCTANETNLANMDLVLGYSAEIYDLLGQATTLVASWFEDTVELHIALTERETLLSRLETIVLKLSYGPIPPTEVYSYVNDRTNYRRTTAEAGCAYARATQIFLLRSIYVDNVKDERLHTFVTFLQALAEQVPPDCPAFTVMMWPLWVLGCESSKRNIASRDWVSARLLALYEREGLRNVLTCLNTLKNRIWTLEDVSDDGADNGMALEVGPVKNSSCSNPTQSRWPQFCWLNQIQLSFA